MQKSNNRRGESVLILGGLVLLFSLTFARVYLRVQTMLTGYHIGQLKESESQLLLKRSHLQMQLAKISSKQQLLKLSAKEKKPNPKVVVP